MKRQFRYIIVLTPLICGHLIVLNKTLEILARQRSKLYLYLAKCTTLTRKVNPVNFDSKGYLFCLRNYRKNKQNSAGLCCE